VPANDATPRRGGSGFRAFWTSLPGVLTGVAAVIGAVATLAALFGAGGRDPGTGSTGSAPVAVTPAADTTVTAGGTCFERFFAGVPANRVGQIEAGTPVYDVIPEHRQLSGPIGLLLTSHARPIGAVRYTYIEDNGVFSIDGVVDDGCRPIRTYENAERGAEPDVVQSNGTLRIALGGVPYDLGFTGGTVVRMSFVRYRP
jgi:hypothetical protein